LLGQAQTLSQNYLKAEQEATELLSLDDVLMVNTLQRFLNNPVDELIREIFTPLFDLLKLKVDIQTFKENASQAVEASFKTMYQLGYEKWVVLSLVKLLEADELLQVPPPKLSFYDFHKSGGSLDAKIHPPEGSKTLCFKYAPDTATIVPDFIVHSAKINRYIAVRSQINRSFAAASKNGETREWLPVDSAINLGFGTTLIYADGNPDEICLVADAEKICRPDLVLECHGQRDWFEKVGLERTELIGNNLKPNLGTYIISRDHIPEQALADQDGRINILEVGFDHLKLEPIIKALSAYN
jgi:hypothetical protein